MAAPNKKHNSNEPPWKVSLQLIDPDLAKELLRNNYINRPISMKTVDKYEGDMTNDLWIEPTPIYRTVDDKLLDGQHRLTALIAASKPLWFVVVDGVSPDMIDAIDGGSRRTDTQRLVMHGKAKQIGGLLGSMLGYVLHYKEHRIGGPSISFPTKWWFCKEYEHMEEYATYWSSVDYDGINMKKPMVAAFHFLTSKVDKEKADEFFNQLLQNGDLEEGSPARALKEFAEKFPRKQTPGQIRMTGIALLAAWQAFADGKVLRKITPSAEILRLPIKW